MSEKIEGNEQLFNDDEIAFKILDTSKVYTKASIILGVVHHILRPDEWLILRTIDWFQSIINVFLGAWIIGFINVIVKLLMEHNSPVKIQKLDISEFYTALTFLVLWLIGLFIYKGRFNQKWKFTQVDRQFLVDEIDSKLRLKFKRNGH